MGEKKHTNKIPPKIPGQSREKFVYVFFSLCFFSLPIPGAQAQIFVFFFVSNLGVPGFWIPVEEAL